MNRSLDEANFSDFIRESFDALPWDPEPDSDFSILSLFHLAKEHCERRGIYVGAIDIDDLNAVAFEHKGSECIGITRGTIEQLHHALGLVASCMKEPFFDAEQPWDDEKRLDATRFRKGRQDELHLSNGQRALWQALMDVSVVFILHHELGHLESGHIYWLQQGLRKNRAALFERPLDHKSNAELLGVDADNITALEVDADTDAVTATLELLDGISYTSDREGNLWLNLLENNDTRYPIVDIAFNIVFVLFSHQTASVESYHGSHPHPDIRGAYCNAGALVYCSQPNQEEALQAYRRWRTSPHLSNFYWEMHYVLKGPYHLQDYLANAKSLSGKINKVTQELWEHSKPIWNNVAEYADERRKKRDSARERK
ncbi:MAG: hypothetical protein AABY54_04125 [Deltaproteobacteria bacterium]